MFYVLILEPFLCKLKVNLVLCRIILPIATILDRYSTYVDCMNKLVTSNAEIDRYDMVTGDKINCDAYWLVLRCMERSFSVQAFEWMEGFL